MRVNTDELEQQAMEIRRIAARLNDIESSVFRVSRILNRERFGERFRSPLVSAAGSIMRRSDELSKMSAALLQISQLYEKTETGIMDEAEHANVHYDFMPIGIIRLPDWIIRPIGPHPRPIWPIIPEEVWETMEMSNGSSGTFVSEEPPLETIERSDNTLYEIVDDLLAPSGSSVQDHVPAEVIPNPAADTIGLEGMLRELFENLPDGTGILGESAAADSPLISTDGSGLIDWTPWEP